MIPGPPRAPLELWGGVECTVNRLGDTFRDQLALTGHDRREDDLDRFAALGLRTLRFPVLWERTAPAGIEHADWRWPDRRLERARELGLRPIVGLVHHGSGPADTNLLDPSFPERLANYARSVAERYPWVTAYTPVNEPLTTARFSALYGHWYPHTHGDREFVRAVLAQCRGSILAMRAIREITPEARLVQTEDLGRTYSTRLLRYQADFDNDRRWLSFDLLAGRLQPADRMWRHLRALGIEEGALDWFPANRCAPDILGINHYITSNRYLDTRRHLYPPDTWGGNGRHGFADVAAARVVESPAGAADLLAEAWQRYRIPLAVTEVHLGCTREEQLRWLLEVWQAANAARESGVDVRAVTAWALLGAFDWNSLLTSAAGHYEPGAFDVRGPAPRITALGRMVGDLATGRPPSQVVARTPGWWRREVRFTYGPGSPAGRMSGPRATERDQSQPLVVTGAGGTLGSAFERIAALRGLDARLLRRADLDIADPAPVRATLEKYRPWAVVNAAGYVRVDEAERDRERCYRENVDGPAALAQACGWLGIRLVTFSSDLVFSGAQPRPYVESDPVAPANVYGASKAEAERRVREIMPSALVVRTSAFFGPWDAHNMLTRALAELRAGREWVVPAAVVSPTYVPDLVNAVLDLLIDGEQGIWHLANVGEVSWLEMVRRGAELAGVGTERLREAQPSAPALRPIHTALSSERGLLLPTFEDALARFVRSLRDQLASTGPTESFPTLPAASA
ncbi:MAG: sugar nucleotide-binding protein [Gemmatimonadales bacterium]|nr:sugar nucleotide-binding protein [Gemmatimonadales bacterium]